MHSHSTWIEVDRAALENNARALSALSDAALMAVVKANAYGHGAAEVARAAVRGGATWLGVARPAEALLLREVGVREPILMLGPAPEGSLDSLVGAGVSLTVFTGDHIAAAAAAGRSVGAPARAHLKIDTGMSRLGAAPDEARTLGERLQAEPYVDYEGLFTHFARADEPGATATGAQLERFQAVVSELESMGLRPPLVHAANSAAALTIPESHFDLIRCGIALYGLRPSSEEPPPEGLAPALTWKTRLVRLRRLPPGTGVSYGHEYVTRGEELIGTIPVGYGDGLRRIAGNVALVGGRRVPVVGRVCMDLTMLQLDSVPEASEGDEAVLIGEQGEAQITAEEVARIWGTINYEVTCGIAARVPRL